MASTDAEETVELRVTVENRQGLHARPSSMLAETALKFEGTELTLKRGELEVNAKSIMELLMLEAACGTELTLCARGPNAEEALQVIRELFECQFHVKY